MIIMHKKILGDLSMALVPSLEGKLRLPVVGAPLFIVSGPELVIAQCKAGIVGSFPALNARPQSMLGEWLTRIKEELAEYDRENPESPSAPYAVNQICHASNDRLMDDMQTCVDHEVQIIITSLRPPLEIVQAAHSYGGVVFHDVINVKHAKKAAKKIIKEAKKDPGNYSNADVLYAKLLLSRLKKEKTQCTNTELKK